MSVAHSSNILKVDMFLSKEMKKNNELERKNEKCEIELKIYVTFGKLRVYQSLTESRYHKI